MANCQWKHKVHTSTAYRYSNEDWSEDENRSVYGLDASTAGVGYNLILEAKVDSKQISEDEFRKKLYDTSRLIDHKFLNTDVSEFKARPVSLERIALFIREKLGIQGVELRLTELGRCSVETTDSEEMVLTLFDKLNAVHRHWNPDLSADENKELYGKCSAIHGHEYNVEVSFIGKLDEKTGLVGQRDELKALIKEAIVDPLHGSYLNDHLGNTSGEKIAFQLLERVKKCPMTQQPHRIVVRETRKNSFKVGASLF